MYQALYRKYRPRFFSDVVGQKHITSTLKNSISNGKIFHAYLFTGTRGTGKTTCAKILAKAVCCLNPQNGEPCGECESCKAIASGVATDICEIDAASNNSVNDIRDLKEQVQFLPVALKYRVYIIDEVHMLSVSAFNALLKTLEEPPKHVIFILATTEVHKLPATILSRCQRFDFRRLDPDDIIKRMKIVADAERFSLSDGAALQIAGLADGGMRDALSILDQCSSCSKNVDEHTVEDVCGIASDSRIFAIADAIGKQDAAEALKAIDEMYRNSIDLKRLMFELVQCFRNIMIIKTVPDTSGLIVCSASSFNEYKRLSNQFSLSQILNILSTLQFKNDAAGASATRSEAELLIVSVCTPHLQNDNAALVQRIEMLEQKLNSVMASTNSRPDIYTAKKIGKTETEAESKKTAAGSENIGELSDPGFEQTGSKTQKAPNSDIQNAQNKKSEEPVLVVQWPDILEKIKKSCPLMAGVLTGSTAYIAGGRLLIDSKLDQFKELINSDAKYRDYVRKAAEEVLGVAYPLGPFKAAGSGRIPSETDPLAEFAKSLSE